MHKTKLLRSHYTRHKYFPVKFAKQATTTNDHKPSQTSPNDHKPPSNNHRLPANDPANDRKPLTNHHKPPSNNHQRP